MGRRLGELRQIIYSEKDRETESLTERDLTRCGHQMWQRKPDGDYGGGVRWRGGVDPRQFIHGLGVESWHSWTHYFFQRLLAPRCIRLLDL